MGTAVKFRRGKPEGILPAGEIEDAKKMRCGMLRDRSRRQKIGDGYTICLGKENRSEVIGEIQRGIEDFAAEWTRRRYRRAKEQSNGKRMGRNASRSAARMPMGW